GVLSASGQAMDENTRVFMESHFGQDLSAVRIHADSQAAESAQAMHAHAYTVGNNIAFNKGQYSPQTIGGKKLLAHELTHVVQQNKSRLQTIQRKAWIGNQPLTVNESYKKIVKDTWGEKALARLMELHTDSIEHKFSSWAALIAEYESAKLAPAPTPVVIEESPGENVCNSLPGFGQRGPSCAAASLITPALIWDKEKYNKDDPSPRLRSIVAKMKTYMVDHKTTLEPRFNGARKGLYQSSLQLLDSIASEAAVDTFVLASSHYEALGLMLMYISQDKLSSGLNDAEMQTARQTLGFPTKTIPVRFFDNFFGANGDLAKMKPGQMAQITWFVKNDRAPSTDPLAPVAKLPTHAFTLGRMEDGTWILNDQGYKKPLCLSGPDLASLKDLMVEASDEGRWAGVTDDDYHEPESGVVTGYTILGDEKTLSP
ncbi:MAG: DUF4157 domain-containing protein, partial [Arenimonas sp.]